MEKDSQSTTQICKHTTNRIKRGTLKQAKQKHSETPTTISTKDDEAYTPSSKVLIDKIGRLKNTRALSTSFNAETKSKKCSSSKYGKKRKQMDKQMCSRSYDDYQTRKNSSHHETDESLRTGSSVRMILDQSEFNRLNYLYEKAILHGQRDVRTQNAGKHVKHVNAYTGSCHRQDNLHQMSSANGKIQNEQTDNSDTDEYSSLEDSTSSSGTEYDLSINHSNGSLANSRLPAENNSENKRYPDYTEGINEHKPLIVEYVKKQPHQKDSKHGRWGKIVPGASIKNYCSTATEESITEWSSSDDDGDISNENSMQHERNKFMTSSSNRSTYSTDTSSVQNSKMCVIL
ncbi:uncharacterized protein LOC117121381 [Anneissia japonica]|uniref:uncharacterized protein LOC117121381 n=1 Tax=Anneissia japonica TaxID=1529436 RepID=UPI0014255A34|nr:uncharacterized protein LOC117121381 [Anneissia japonica]XP_033122459.1 uncharacterized protein LOC117121381 [Anneissia japonica]